MISRSDRRYALPLASARAAWNCAFAAANALFKGIQKGISMGKEVESMAGSISKWYGISREQTIKLIRMFNESAAIGFIPPLRDAMHYIEKLHKEHGYVFHCITSVSVEPNAVKLREMNLHKIFGNAIESVTCLDTGADKDEALAPYKDSGLFWIEDTPENADVGYKLGLNSLLVEHGHNMHHECPYPVVKNWREIYDIITG